jgi:phospholipid-translocating ATPase
MLIREPILKLPDFREPFILQADASDTGIGAVLMQNHDGEKFPIAYASKKLLPRERAYSVIERECLALVWAIRKFQTYLYGKEFLLQTDHQPLVYLDQCKVSNSRIMRWALFLQNYRFQIRSIKGTDNVADYMSRIHS